MNGLAFPALRRAMIALPVLLLSFAALPAQAENPGVARVSLLAGEVAVKRADTGDTMMAAVNAPLMVGDYLTTQHNARAEVEFGSANALRVAGDTQLRFTQLDSQGEALQLAQGTLELRILHAAVAYPQVQTPSISVHPTQVGAYRVTVLDDGSTQVTVRLGRADVTAGTNVQSLTPDGTLLASGSGDAVQVQSIDMIALDDFDRWNADRDRTVQTASSPRYVSPEIVGADDLDAYGRWIVAPGYGTVWAPNVGATWAPYTDGRWVFEPYYGWTWVAAEPWGWAPYHYGRWFYNSAAGWCWYPERLHPVWQPALVTFFSFGNSGFNYGFNNIGWVPLAPFETFNPWWGRPRGGRTIIINNTTNVTNINNNGNSAAGAGAGELRRLYSNASAPGGLVSVSKRSFISGDFSRRMAPAPAQFTHVTVIHGAVPVVPSQNNLVVGAPAARLISAPSMRFRTLPTPVPIKSYPDVRTFVPPATLQPHPVAAGATPWTRFGPERRRVQPTTFGTEPRIVTPVTNARPANALPPVTVMPNTAPVTQHPISVGHGARRRTMHAHVPPPGSSEAGSAPKAP